MDGINGIDDSLRKKKSRMASWKQYLSEEADESWGDLILIVACFISGLVDSAVFNVWSCFVSMQTGNTVYAGLGMSGQPLSQPYRWVKSGTAILSFCLGTYFFSRVCRYLGPLRRGTLSGSFIFQAILCFISCVLVVSDVVPKGAGNQLPKNYIVLLPLGLLSFQSAGQIVMSRMLAYNELPTVVLTSTYCDLMFDPVLFTAPITQNPKRNRRFISAIALFLGAVLGGFLTRDGGIAWPLWIAGITKVVLAIVWLFWGAKGTIRLE
ncbi:uncharacterized protein Z518_03699 [Rhinocladiella mackenziei CBS 650.93]|uniref:Rhinocladiella mackenziei CBS 650.93 unplaced genomic scaffold supercont1.3, whole genome shotgun sequence n=1 Tax=Rhinocladiella mackenziei CBS 650.93 TaxID=1442369 RepID=A0A0D2FUE5_9EURO|nr:uncharacterized protein Z518_03699 [Rhinocladiella mackenziei CBS 650.93]KIX05727.1 hypothetical protein Z518_03699 [Rhinocladiella mackenziei CBS 650.93]